MLENPGAPSGSVTDFSRLNEVPAQGCDLIMKGGVTSGIVYPPAILELARKYRFHSIGGASAGAIAAAAAAAAEYGRQARPEELSQDRPQGFVRFAQMNEELAKPGFVRELFQPADASRPLFEAFLHWQEESAAAQQRQRVARDNKEPPPGLLRRAVSWVERLDTIFEKSVGTAHRTGKLLGLLGAALLTSGSIAWGVSWLMGPSSWLQVLGVLLLCGMLGLLWVGSELGGLIGAVWTLGRVFLRLNDKDQLKYGICPGSAGPGVRLDSGNLALTDWLHVRFNELAGLKPTELPLTLRQLRTRGISFKLVTSNLTLGQPYILPMSRGSRSFFFKRSELERLFPPPVIEALVKWGEDNRPDRSISISDEDARDFLRFPMGEEMPLVVATRLSLSFPVLLSAVRLYSIRNDAYVPLGQYGPPRLLDLTRDVEEHWLSDGGISSNFPIHVFDAWVPRRPTFGITLYDSPLPAVLEQLEPATRSPVLLPRPQDFDKARPQRTAIDGMGDFLRAVFETAQSYRDNAQAGLPSYRERIVQIFLDKTEGGLNLDMPSPIVRRIQDKGRMAAHELLARYPDTRGHAFAEHQWVRMHVLMAELERQLMEVRSIFPEGDWKARLQKSFDELFEAQLHIRKLGATPWYRSKDEAWCAEAARRLDALLGLIEAWDTSQREWEEACRRAGRPIHRGFFAEHPPRPRGMLKVTPDL
jgi:predicted acylesterase/phospholipase RssA